MRRLLGTMVLSMALLMPAGAENRYTLAETEDGTIRLDRHTGAISYCKKVGSGVACSMAADERAALLKSNEELADRVDALEMRIANLERGQEDQPTQAPEAKVNPPEEQSNKDNPLDAEEERQVDKAMRVAETMMRKFIAMAKELKNEFDGN